MNSNTKRLGFIGIVAVLIVAIVLISVFVLKDTVATNPSGGITIVNDKPADAGKIIIKDLYDGELEIPKYDIPISQYAQDKFIDNEGVISYGSDSVLGITVHSNLGQINWQQVKESGVSFAMIRVGFRNYGKGDIQLDDLFETNIQGAINAGLDVGVYFYSQAISVDEAVEEASFVLEKIKGYQVKYPVDICWEFVTNPKNNIVPRTKDCTASEITSYVKAFCGKIKQAGINVSFSATKTMGYDYLDLSQLTDYDMWYYEYRAAPSFHYDFKLWQYSSEGTVAGISEENAVGMTLALKKYS